MNEKIWHIKVSGDGISVYTGEKKNIFKEFILLAKDPPKLKDEFPAKSKLKVCAVPKEISESDLRNGYFVSGFQTGGLQWGISIL